MKTRDEARAAIKNAGITVENVTAEQLNMLHKCLDECMKKSVNYRNTYKMDGKKGHYMTCSTDQWRKREAVSFNRDGFIGFAGWASDENIQPIMQGVKLWLENIKTP